MQQIFSRRQPRLDGILGNVFREILELRDAPEGILLTVTESGFDKLPPERRAKAFPANEGGWVHQMKLIEKYLARH